MEILRTTKLLCSIFDGTVSFLLSTTLLAMLNLRVPYPRLNKSSEGQRTVGSNGEANWATSESWTRWRTIH
jgi:hypothetical protein